MQSQKFDTSKILRYPRLDTVLMVEDFIREHSGEYKKTELWERLPNGVMYQTYSTIIDYLIYSNKIVIDREGHIGWAWDPEGVKYFMGRGVLVAKGSIHQTSGR